jgi:3-hydroxyacyl-[acyl-carrier-protein] dehydratase
MTRAYGATDRDHPPVLAFVVLTALVASLFSGAIPAYQSSRADINEILKTLPHRYPMLLIDRVIKIRTDYSGIGIKNVTFNEPPFLGHFPERPVYPGVMMIEAMAQTAGVIGIKSVEGTEKPRAVYFLTIDKCKFRKPVMPGDTIEYNMRSIGRRKAMWWFHGDAKVNGTVVAEADVGAMLTD